jgi:hypothetical protein
MTLAFGVSVTIGGLRYDHHLTGVRVEAGLAPRAGSAQLLLPPHVRVDAEPGDDITVILDGEDPGTGVFGGQVLRVERLLDVTRIVAGDALARLAAVRPGTTFEQQSARQVVTALAGEAAVPIGAVDAALDLVHYVADQSRTALEHTARLAGWAGSYATSAADGTLVVRRLPTGSAERALRYGREIAALTVGTRQLEPDVVLAGSGPAGSASAPNAHLLTTAILPDSAPAPGVRTVRQSAPALRTPEAARSATSAVATRNGATYLDATCWLQPAIRPGTLIEIADAPQAGASGPWLVTSVVHGLGPGPRGVTRLHGESRGSSGPLSGLLGALGGLL